MIMALFLAITITVVITLIAGKPSSNAPTAVQSARRWVHGLTLFNIIMLLMATGVVLVGLCAPPAVRAAGPAQQAQATADPYASLAAALAAGVACIGAGLAVSSTGSAAIGTIAERPEAFGRALIFVGLAEGIAIYGLIIAFMILSR
jgi:V/A-type H+-transporting ATPase subunit K